MSALDTLLSMRSRGARVWVENGSLRFQAPKGTVGSQDLERLRSFKQEIITLLTADIATVRPLQPRAANERVPLTPIQRLAWSAAAEDRMPHTRTYAFAVRVCGSLNVDILRRAVETMRARHDILRTRLVSLDGVPAQAIDDAPPGRPVVVDLSTRRPAGMALDEELRAFVETRVHFADRSLFEARLLRLGDSYHVLAVSLDGTITDCTSNDILCREIWDTYAHLARGRQPPPVPQSLQFADYSVWLQQVESDWAATHATYWRARLGNADPTRLSRLGRAADANRAPEISIPMGVDEDVARELPDLASRMQAFPALIVLTAYVATLFTWLGRRDLTVMLVDHGRHLPGLENMVGCLVNHLFLRFEGGREQTFGQLLQQVRDELDRAVEHRDFNRARSLVPGIETDFYFNWVTARGIEPLPRDEEIRDLGIKLRPHPVTPRSALPAFGVVFRHDAAISGTVKYRADSCEADGAEVFRRMMTSTLRSFVRQPAQPIASTG